MHTHALRIAGLTLAIVTLSSCSGSTTASRALDAARSSVSFEPATIVAGDDAGSTVRIRIANSAGGGIPGVSVAVAMPQAGGAIVQPTVTTGGDGVTVATFSTTRAGSWTPLITVSIDGVDLTFSPTTPLIVEPAEPSAAHSELHASPAVLVADGVAESSVTLRLRDRFGNAVPGASAALAVSGYEASLGATTVTTDASGVGTTTLSATRLGPKQIVASIDESGIDTELSARPTVTFTPIVAADESEPNDAPAQAQKIALGTAAYGSVLSAGDVDFWSVDLHEGEVVSVAVFAARFAQAAWVTNENIVRVTVWDGSGVQKLVEQDYSGNASDGWDWAPIDLDLPRFRAPSDGSYLISITPDFSWNDGGPYALMVLPVDLGPIVDSTTPLDSDAVVYGQHRNLETNTITVTLANPSIVSVDLWAYRLGVSHTTVAEPDYYDSYLTVREQGGIDELENDDDSFYDAGIAAALPAGVYEIEVGEYEFNESDGPFFADVRIEPQTTSPEIEPNGSPNEAMPLAAGQMVAGSCVISADEDYYVFDAKIGDHVRVEVFGPDQTLPIPATSQSVAFEILDPTLAPKSVNVGWGVPVAATLITSTGQHYIRVWVGDDLTTDYMLRLTIEPALHEVEPNDEASTANPMPPITPIFGTIDVADDTDSFAFEVTEANQLVAFSLICQTPRSDAMHGRSQLGSALEGRLIIRNAQGGPLAVSDGDDPPFSQSLTTAEAGCEVAFRAPFPGTYYVEVVDQYGNASAEHYYLLRRIH